MLALLAVLALGQVTSNNCKSGGADCIARSFRSTQAAAGSNGRIGAFCQASASGSWAWGLENAGTLYSLMLDTGGTSTNSCPRSGGFTVSPISVSSSGAGLVTLGYLTTLTQGSVTFGTAATASPAALSATADRLQVDAVTGKLWVRDLTGSTTPTYDLAAGQHPVLNGFTAAGRVGAESTVCPLVTLAAPQQGASAGSPISHTCTVTAAASSQIGSTGRSYRMSATLGVTNSRDTVVTQAFVQPRQGPRLCAWVYVPAVITFTRLYVGLFSAVPTADLPTTSFVGFRFSTGAPDSNWQLCSADGTTGSCVDTGIAVSGSREYVLCVDYRAGTTLYGQVQAESAAPAFVAKATNVPDSAANLIFAHSVEALSNSTRGFGLSSWSVEQR